MRQGRPGCARVVGPADAARRRDDRRRHGRLKPTVSGKQGSLLELARSLAGAARDGEQIEAYAVRSRDVDVNAFDGEVEPLATAEIEGVGVRVIVDHREGYAWAGSLDPDVVADTLADARDNAAFGAQDEFFALATPDDFAGVVAADLDLWRDDVLALPTADKVAMAIDLESMTKKLDPRIRALRSASYGDA